MYNCISAFCPINVTKQYSWCFGEQCFCFLYLFFFLTDACSYLKLSLIELKNKLGRASAVYSVEFNPNPKALAYTLMEINFYLVLRTFKTLPDKYSFTQSQHIHISTKLASMSKFYNSSLISHDIFLYFTTLCHQLPLASY